MKDNPTNEDPVLPTSSRDTAGSAASPATPAPPQQLGVYQLQGRLGQGGMGTVWKAWHTRLKRPVALKTIRPECLDNPPAVARFQREMEAVGKLDHANLIRATDAGEDAGIHFLVMDFVEGTDASRLVQRHGPLPIADACEVVRQAALGLQFAHEAGLVHRDVKPSNLMVTRQGQVKVLDLGLALLHAAPDETGELTGSNQWMGTADFMAPEQGTCAHTVDIRADVYSLGCTLYKLLAGRAPFSAPEYSTPYKKMEAHAREPVPPLRDRRPEVPAGLAAVLDRMLAKSPVDRFSTPGEVAAALAPFAAGCDLPRLVAREAAALPSPSAETGPFGPPTPAASPGPLLPATVAPRATPWRRWWAAGILASAGLIAGLLARWPPGKPESTVPTARTFAPGLWHNVLERGAEEWVWPRGELTWSFDPRQQQVQASCRTLGLLRFGTTPDGGYKLQVGISQPRWTGGVGLFFGGREERDGDATVLRYQRIELVQREPERGPRQPAAFALVRSRAQLRKQPGGEQTTNDLRVALEPLASLAPHEYILEVEVDRQGALHAVRWGTQELPSLVAPQVNSLFTPGDGAGSFGGFIGGGAGNFSNARILVLEKDEP